MREDFAYAIPDALGDEEAAPLLCAGIIGFRAIKRAEVRPGATVGLYGFGGSAHLAIQVLKHWRCRVFVMSRGGRHQELAEELGADWIGAADAPPPHSLTPRFCSRRPASWCRRRWRRSTAAASSRSPGSI